MTGSLVISPIIYLPVTFESCPGISPCPPEPSFICCCCCCCCFQQSNFTQGYMAMCLLYAWFMRAEFHQLTWVTGKDQISDAPSNDAFGQWSWPLKGLALYLFIMSALQAMVHAHLIYCMHFVHLICMSFVFPPKAWWLTAVSLSWHSCCFQPPYQ